MTTILEAGMHCNSAKMASSSEVVKSEVNYDTVRTTVRDTISRESFDEIRRVVRDIEKLSKIERLLLYLELPSSISSLSDPLRQPLNPLGSRFEIQLTITWIKTHLEEDQQVSLPKHEVYDDYLEYCNANSLKPLSTADFGKVMKQVYPQVRPRRLGTRGNSRYCYAGLKKRLKLEEPSTPECGGGKPLKVCADIEQELNEATSLLIREWAEKLLTVKFSSLRELALYLIDKMFVDHQSSAAHTVLSTMAKSRDDAILKHKPDGILINGNNSQLYDHKRKIEVPVSPPDLSVKRPNLKRSKTLGLSSIDNNSYNLEVKSPLSNELVTAQDKQQHPAVSVSMVGADPSNQFTSVFEEDDSTHQFLSHHHVEEQQRKQLSVLTNSSNNSSVVVNATSVSANTNKSEWVTNNVEINPNIDPWCDQMDQSNNPVNSNNSNNLPGGGALDLKEPIDEELDKYFKDNEDNTHKLSQLRHMLEKNLKSPSLNFKPASGSIKTIDHHNPEVVSGVGGWANANAGSNVVNLNASENPANVVNMTSNQNTPLNTRRRVSFIDPLIVQEPQQQQQQQNHHQNSQAQQPHNGSSSNGSSGILSNNTGQSPGTRKRHFSFQPISPRQASLPQSPLASPFISPRSTPVHMLRSRHSSGSALPLHMLPQGNTTTKGPFGSSGSDISRAATFGSASECSTPFISPHGTPIPFNRSRHNSAQGRLCRSRHSSGVGPYRYTMTPFSPMALNNLNNPYSPQPATPLGSTSGEDVFNLNNTSYVVDNSSVNVVTAMEDAVVNSQQVVLAPNDDRSRHSSAESDPNLVKSAPMSPHGHLGGGHHHHVVHGHHHQNSYSDSIGDRQRLRHQSAGNPPNPAFATLKPPEWLTHQDPNLMQNFVTNSDELQEAMLGQSRPQSVPICEMASAVVVTSGMEFLPSSILETEPRGNKSSSDDLVIGAAADLTNNHVVVVSTTATTSASASTTAAAATGTASGSGGGGGGANDDLDLTLSALKDCDKDFKKFVQEQEN